MSKAFGIAFAAAICVIALIIWRGFVETKGNHLEPTGRIGKVREMKVDADQVVLILDFNLKNDSDVAMVVRKMEGDLEAADGSTVEGHMISAPDLPNLFRNYPAIGEQYNPPMKAQDTIAAHTSVDRMVGIRFDVPEQTVVNRRHVIFRVQDMTGPIVELRMPK